MPIFEDETHSYEDLKRLKKWNVCAICGEWLNFFMDAEGKTYLACNDYLRSGHEGIIREASPYQMDGLASLNIETRREIMEEQHGKGITTALAQRRLPTSGALTKNQAMEILKLVYPDVPESQITRTAMLCRDFGLHPLMKEVYIIGFKNKSGGMDYSTVVGIQANRKMAADKKGAFSFLDDTPRAASQGEIDKQYGKDSEEEKNNLISITKLKGEKGNLAVGFGLWPKSKEPYGTDKGNTKRNMANIRSERQALDRLPGEALPREFEVIDASFVEVPEVGKVDKETGEVVQEVEPPAIEAKAEVVEPKAEPKTPPAPKKAPPAKAEPQAPPPSTSGTPDTTDKLLAWVCEARGYGSHTTARDFLVKQCDILPERIDSEPDKVYGEVKDFITKHK